MECLRTAVYSADDGEALKRLTVEEPDERIRKKVMDNWDAIAKPIAGMGRFENLLAQIGAITGSDQIDISRKAVLIMCADNGIVEEGVSQSGQEVTSIMAKEMAAKRSPVGIMAEAIGADTFPVDIGINSEEPIQGIVDRRVRAGTRNFRKEPAMTEQEAIRAIFTGINLVYACKQSGYQILATGELGIGNTTTAGAVAAALLRCKASEVTGRGSGLSNSLLLKKQQVIAEALENYHLYEADPLSVLIAVGGLDIAGLAGVCIGGALYHLPVVLDGVISLAAALLAERLVPGSRDYLLPSHMSREPAAIQLVKELRLEPVLDAQMGLGEGTGAVMMLSLLDTALCVYRDGRKFTDVNIRQYERYEVS